MPKIGHDWWGTGMHLHMSLGTARDEPLRRREGREDGSESPRVQLHRRLSPAICRALSAVAAPMPNSYKRLLPGKWNADAAAYGAGARGAAVRIPDERGKATRIECRFPDGTMNPYLALGSILVCGWRGSRGRPTRDWP